MKRIKQNWNSVTFKELQRTIQPAQSLKRSESNQLFSLDFSPLISIIPISNPSFISKLLKNIFEALLRTHLSCYNLYFHFQSGFCPLHSTETAFHKIFNNRLFADDIFLLPDLTSVFDTIPRAIFLERLHNHHKH